VEFVEFAVLATLLLTGTLARAADGARDQTGIQWVLPFPEALKKAKAERRLLLIKPIAFGTSKDGGW